MRPARGRVALGGRVLLQALDVAPRGERPLLGEPRLRDGIELGLGGLDDDVDAGHPAQLAQLRVRERGLRRAAAAEHDDPADRALAQRGECVVGDIGARQLVGIARQQPGDVRGDVAVADDHGGLVREVGREVAIVGVAVVPADERGRGEAAGQLLARDAERPVRLRADGVDHRVVAAHEIGVRDVGAHGDVAEEAAPGAEDGAVERLVQALDLTVVGRDARPQEAPRRGQALDEVDVGPAAVAAQLRRGERPGRARADDGDARAAHCTTARSAKNSAFRSIESSSFAGTSTPG